MLRTIPRALLTDTVVVKVQTGFDRWQVPVYTSTTVKNVHLQNTNELRKTPNNTEVVLRSILFIDSRLSTPRLDYDSLVAASQAAGLQMRCVVYDHFGKELGDYAVETCDPVPDYPSTRLHHVELGLV